MGRPGEPRKIGIGSSLVSADEVFKDGDPSELGEAILCGVSRGRGGLFVTFLGLFLASKALSMTSRSSGSFSESAVRSFDGQL